MTTVPGSRLRAAVGERAEILSHHHQGVDRLGDGLEATAHAHDGVVEGIEEPSHRFAVGVLWHPDAEPDTGGAPLFQALISSTA